MVTPHVSHILMNLPSLHLVMPVDIATRVGRRLRYLREQKGMTQEMLSAHAGITHVALVRIESRRAEAGSARCTRLQEPWQ